MSNAIADLWRSERGLLCLVILLAATVLAALGKTDFSGWSQFVMVVYGTYVAGKTASSMAERRKPTTKHETTVTATTTDIGAGGV